MTPETETIDKLFLELSQFTKAQTGREILQREFFCHWLVRAYDAGHRDTSYEEGESLDNVLREINQVLGFAGYEIESWERAKLLTRKFTWNELEQP